MLVVPLSVSVGDTKIIFTYNFGAPLNIFLKNIS